MAALSGAAILCNKHTVRIIFLSFFLKVQIKERTGQPVAAYVMNDDQSPQKSAKSDDNERLAFMYDTLFGASCTFLAVLLGLAIAFSTI